MSETYCWELLHVAEHALTKRCHSSKELLDSREQTLSWARGVQGCKESPSPARARRGAVPVPGRQRGPRRLYPRAGRYSGLDADSASDALGCHLARHPRGRALRCARYPVRSIHPVSGMIVTLGDTLAFRHSESDAVYAIAKGVTEVVLAFVVPYLFGICTQMDPTCTPLCSAGLCSKMRLATGPVTAGRSLAHDDYGLLINVTVTPVFAANSCTVQCVAAFGFRAIAVCSNSAIRSSSCVRRRPGRTSSLSPDNRCARKRHRQNLTVGCDTFSRRAACARGSPSSVHRIICARRTIHAGGCMMGPERPIQLSLVQSAAAFAFGGPASRQLQGAKIRLGQLINAKLSTGQDTSAYAR